MLFDTQSLRTVRRTVQSKGAVAGAKQLYSIIGIPSIEIHGLYPKNGPVLFVSNHNGVLDSHLLVQSIQRADFKFVALNIYHVFGYKDAGVLFPITRHIPLLHRLYEFPLEHEIVGTYPHIYSIEEARDRNRTTIEHVAKWISTGHAASIFPTGGVGKLVEGYIWKSGVGHLVKSISNPKTNIVFVHIQGTRKTDVASYLRPALRSFLFHSQTLQITFSKPYSITDFVNKKDNGRTIAQKMEREYRQLFPSSF